MAKQHGEFESVRAAILETAAKLFTSRGIHEASLADIAKDAKLSKGTISYYYPSKDHLINDISDYHFGRITDMIFVWIETLDRDTGPRDALSVIFEAFTEDESIYKLHMVPVSYTHLDVYKRQVPNSITINIAIISLFMLSPFKYIKFPLCRPYNTGAGSYECIDVYKRQI